MPRAFGVRVTGSRGILANLYAHHEGIAEGLRGEIRATAADWRTLARSYAPKDTHNLEQSLATSFSPGALAWQGFHDPAFYHGENYGDLQEVGFVHYLSGEFIQSPHMVPAFREIELTAGARLGNVVRRQLR